MSDEAEAAPALPELDPAALSALLAAKTSELTDEKLNQLIRALRIDRSRHMTDEQLQKKRKVSPLTKASRSKEPPTKAILEDILAGIIGPKEP